jgi:archaeal flagellin FlaB
MKANQKSLLANDTRAQVGIGTMIVFIATILVAATAAAVLIDTSGKLQERSSSTGTEATQQVASNLVLLQVTGSRADVDDDIQHVNFTLSLAPGASLVDLQQLKVRISDGSDITTFSYVDGPSDVETFNATFQRDHGDTNPVMSRGDLVSIHVDLAANSLEIEERQRVSVTFIPEVGSQLDSSFTAPLSFGSSKQILLR